MHQHNTQHSTTQPKLPRGNAKHYNVDVGRQVSSELMEEQENNSQERQNMHGGLS
jgi:hypothetical protein